VLSHSLNFARSFFRFYHSAQSFCVFLCHFVRHGDIEGRGVGGRSARRRRMWRSLAGTRGAEEAAEPVGEAMGGGGRGAHRWWGGARCSRKQRSPTGEAWGVGGRGVMSSGVRSGDAGLVAWGWESRGRESRCRSGSVGSGGWRGVGRANSRGVGRLGTRGLVGRAGWTCAGSVGWAHEGRSVNWTIGSR
jgi:hypothetical protein